jgi:hypothetical protein
VGLRRPDADRLAALERGRQQLHGLPHGDIPVGAYDSMRLSNIGIGHGAIDGGGG